MSFTISPCEFPAGVRNKYRSIRQAVYSLEVEDSIVVKCESKLEAEKVRASIFAWISGRTITTRIIGADLFIKRLKGRK